METCKYGLGASTRKPPTARWVWRWVLSPPFYPTAYFAGKSTNASIGTSLKLSRTGRILTYKIKRHETDYLVERGQVG